MAPLYSVDSLARLLQELVLLLWLGSEVLHASRVFARRVRSGQVERLHTNAHLDLHANPRLNANEEFVFGAKAANLAASWGCSAAGAAHGLQNRLRGAAEALWVGSIPIHPRHAGSGLGSRASRRAMRWACRFGLKPRRPSGR